jgi:hypothetical protein
MKVYRFMQIIHHSIADKKLFKSSATANVHLFYVEIKDLKGHADNLIAHISDTSWISKLDPVGQATYKARVERTVVALVKKFLGATTDDALTQEFGEYIISLSASESLKNKLAHKTFPISELWKEKALRNHGFDFHTQSPGYLISFGEAKYSKDTNSYSAAAEQVLRFIGAEKDLGDSGDLERLQVHADALNRLIKKKEKGFAIAFSLSSKNPMEILNNAVKSELIQKLSVLCEELFIIGIKI